MSGKQRRTDDDVEGILARALARMDRLGYPPAQTIRARGITWEQLILFDKSVGRA